MKIKQQIERLREEARRAKEQGRMEDAERVGKEADRLEQKLREQGPRQDERQAMKRKLEELRQEAQRAKEQGRREEAERLGRDLDRLEQQSREQGPRGDERQAIKGKIEDLRNEARRAKEQGRPEEAERLGNEANRLEQQLREQGPREKGKPERPMPPEVQDILRAAEQAEREGRMDDARRQREKADIVARQLQEQKGQGPESPDRSFRDQVMRSIEGLKQEMGRLWQAVNEMRNRPREGQPR